MSGIFIAFLFSSFQNLKITKPYTVIIDAGHGGKDKGCSAESVLEKDLSLLYAQLIGQKLIAEGIGVIQLREKDEFISLNDRVDFTNQHQADLLLSIHINQGTSQLHGMQVYLPNNYIQDGDTNLNYFPSMRFASQLSNKYGKNLKIMPAPFTILKNADCPAALVELGFLSNDEEREKLLHKEYQSELSALIAQSVVKSMN
ncbi:MAG: N-acetylmuramoyl-L-alanine amidase [Vicingaceae bacterium]